MPKTRFQRMIFALITVFITVHAYVFYSLYVLHGTQFMQITGANSVLSAIRAMGGVSLLGRTMPIWCVVLTEFVLAYLLEITLGSPWSFQLVCRVFQPGSVHPVLFETAIITATVGIMCPAMSFLAAILYFPFSSMEFHILTLLAEWGKLVCFNLPFAFFSQLLFIQPAVRTIFRFLFRPTGNEAVAFG